MGKNSDISWTTHTHNLWWGCTKKDTGCKNCYAETWSRRSGENYWGASAPRRFFKQSHYRQPYAWDRSAARLSERHRVFCGSMMDLFERHPIGTIAAEMAKYRVHLMSEVIPATLNIDWLLLTKRLENVLELVPPTWHRDWPRNVWLGFSASTQDEYLAGMKDLISLANELSIFPPVFFISLEPLVEPVALAIGPLSALLDWVIVGGESGKNARSMHPDWARRVRDDCIREDIPFFFKQWGEWKEIQFDKRGKGDILFSPTNGKIDRLPDPFDGNTQEFKRTVALRPVGKKAAGDILDGRKWQQVPEVQHEGMVPPLKRQGEERWTKK